MSRSKDQPEKPPPDEVPFCDRERRRSSILRELGHLRESNNNAESRCGRVSIGIGVVCAVVACTVGIFLLQPFISRLDAREDQTVDFYQPKASDIRALQQVTQCPEFPSDKLVSVAYDYFDEDHPHLNHVQYLDGITTRISAYAKHIGKSGQRAKRDVYNRTERIIGGSPAIIKQFPFFVSLHSHSHDQHMCGGSIITKSWIISAAHCIEAIPKLSAWLVHAGISTNDELDDPDYHWEHRSDVTAIILHPNWDQASYNGDVALMKMKTPIEEYSDYIQPHCLPFNNGHSPRVVPGQKVKVVGFGFTDENAADPSTILRQVDITMFKNSDCNIMFENEWVHEDMICAGELSGGQDACQGDSGGPLSYHTIDGENEIWWLFGTVSFGVGCGRKNLGGVYAEVSHFADWASHAIAHYDSAQNTSTG